MKNNRLILLLIFFFLVQSSNAQWKENGIPICDTTAKNPTWMLPRIANDGEGGVFICWTDLRNINYDIFAQRVNKDGQIQWQKNGIPICDDPYNQHYSRIISDGRGGAFVVWEDNREYNIFIYAQWIDRNGREKWQKNGIKVADRAGLFASISNDSNDGILVAWNSQGSFGLNCVVVQKVNFLGQRVWGDSGILCTDRQGAIYPNDVAVLSDGKRGAYVGWSQGEYFKGKVYIQRIDSSGNILWQKNGIEVGDSTYNIDIGLSSDRNGGAILSWANLNTVMKYIQRISSEGNFLWAPKGIALGGAAGGGSRRHTPDGKGGAFIGHSKWIQHIDSSGSLLWGENGAQYVTSLETYYESAQAAEKSGGVWNFWTSRDSLTYEDIFGQYIDSNGLPRWGPNGIVICNATWKQCTPDAVGDNAGNAFVVWMDIRGRYPSIYLAKVDTSKIITSSDVRLLHPVLSPRLNQNYPNPFNPRTRIQFFIPKRTSVRLCVYDVLGREMTQLSDKIYEAGEHDVEFNAKALSAGIYFYRLIIQGFIETRKMIVLH
jgi:hypothetical protein